MASNHLPAMDPLRPYLGDCMLSPACRDDVQGYRLHAPLATVFVVYFVHLLGQCNSDGVLGSEVTTDNYSAVYVSPGPASFPTRQAGDDLPDVPTFNQSTLVVSGLDPVNGSTNSTTGDRLTGQARGTTMSGPTLNTPAFLNTATNDSRQPTVSLLTTDKPKVYTPRDIYIRGHLLRHPPPGPRTFKPDPDADRLFMAQNSAGNFRDLPDGASSRRKRKHSSGKTRYYNYKMLYDTIKGAGTGKKKTEFYAWIFGAAMLGLGSLTTISSCFVFCFCSDRVRKRRESRARRGNDKAGQYQRVESVSSIVDHAGDHPDLYDDQMDSVTII